MREQRQVVERWHRESALILVTLVRVQGSSYRQPGARLIVCKDGSYEGGISAGCLEADLLRKAAWLTRDGAAVERYSTLFDEPAEMPFGLGCGGVLDVLLESVSTHECQALLSAIEASLAGQENIVVTWLPSGGNSVMRAVFHADGQLIFASPGLSNESLAQARVMCLDGTNSGVDGIFMERLVPPQRLYVLGAGDDAKPLVTMASLLGWSVTVVDGRTHLARRSRFPESDVRVMSNPDGALREIGPRDAVVIMSHRYEQDAHCLLTILPARPRYLGLLGSRQRSALLIADVAARLRMPVSECCELICAPVGLDLGGDGPEAIALAIIAEAQACIIGKGDACRKLSSDQVERYRSTSDARCYLQTQCGLDVA
jgi:xanthine dehydrogenase accessory factor